MAANLTGMTGDRRLICAVAVAVFSLVFLVFSRSLGGEFLGWDDWGLLVDNPRLVFSPANLWWMLTHSFHGPYQPVAWLSLGLDRLIWGLDPFGFHLTANLLHASTAVLCFLWARSLAGYLAPGLSLKRQVLAGVAVALLFALHPLRVETTSWLSARRDQLMGLFTMACLLAYHRVAPRFLEREMPFRAAKNAVVFFLLACLSKAPAVTVTVVLVVLDLQVYRRFSTLGFAARVWRGIGEKSGFFLAGLGVGLVAVVSQKFAGGGMLSFSDYGLEARLAQSALSLSLMLKQIFWPDALSPLVELRFVPSFRHASELGSLIFLSAVSFLFWYWRKKWPALLAAWTVFVVCSLPTAGLMQTGQQLIADRYAYLPSLPWAVLAGLSLLALPAAQARFPRRLLTAGWRLLLTVMLVILTVLTWRQQGVWRNTENLWRQVLALDEANYTARIALARTLVAEKRSDEAATLLMGATRLREEAPDAWLELGKIELNAGRCQHAVVAFRQALKFRPQDGEASRGLRRALEDLEGSKRK
ncbi:MAG: hypothetical protein PHV34_06830 [Verrucomicrobiae bacterium]|nr:hypothetical protein [Verrucomicrobiae bacterium]